MLERFKLAYQSFISKEVKIKEVVVLSEKQIKELEKIFVYNGSDGATTHYKAGYIIGIQTVIKKLRDGL